MKGGLSSAQIYLLTHLCLDIHRMSTAATVGDVRSLYTTVPVPFYCGNP